jgi:hypothetical protein
MTRDVHLPSSEEPLKVAWRQFTLLLSPLLLSGIVHPLQHSQAVHHQRTSPRAARQGTYGQRDP